MKKFIIVILVSFFSKNLVGQSNVGIVGDTNWTNLWTNFNPKNTEYNEATEILVGDITQNVTLYKKNVYTLKGIVTVKNNAILTIEAGTVIKSDIEDLSALIITKSAKIIANGSETDPIVFTSSKPNGQRKAGDWGGIIVMGNAPTNVINNQASLDFISPNISGLYGGTDINSDSGILNYVRIEFAGKKLNTNKDFNGLSIAGVGKKTVLNNIQVSFSDDDSIEVYGGNVFLNNLVSYKATDDDFDFTQGVQATISNSLALRNPYISSPTISRCLEIENYIVRENTDYSKPNTNIYASNITLINTETKDTGLVKEAIYITEGCALTFLNSVIHGFNQGFIFEDKISENNGLSKIKIENIIFNGCKVVSKFETLTDEIDFNDKFVIERKILADLVREPNFKKTIDFRVKNNSAVVFNK